MSLSVGYGERVITPPLGADLCGYGFYLDRKAEGVMDDLKARALCVRSGETALVLVGLDLIGLTIEDADEVRGRIAEALSIPRAQVLLGCSHTHSGPATQTLPGLGEMSAAYMKMMKAAVVAAAEEAAAAPRPARLTTGFETIEPIGYDRRAKDFRVIDPVLKTAAFQTEDGEKIYLFNYACHGVVLGPQKRISADWPGAAVRALERDGHRGLFLQGFCGDIDPVTQANRWGQGTEEDLAVYGDLVARRIPKAERFGEIQDGAALGAAEARIDLPLRIFTKREIESRSKAFAKLYAQFPGGARFAAEWKETALSLLEEFRKAPAVANVPVQALALGRLRILALPGEIFGGYGTALRKGHPLLMPVGYANGNIGYIPSRRAYGDPSDYAAWCAPFFYTVFPFTPDVGARLTRTARRVIKNVSSPDF